MSEHDITVDGFFDIRNVDSSLHVYLIYRGDDGKLVVRLITSMPMDIDQIRKTTSISNTGYVNFKSSPVTALIWRICGMDTLLSNRCLKALVQSATPIQDIRKIICNRLAHINVKPSDSYYKITSVKFIASETIPEGVVHRYVKNRLDRSIEIIHMRCNNRDSVIALDDYEIAPTNTPGSDCPFPDNISSVFRKYDINFSTRVEGDTRTMTLDELDAFLERLLPSCVGTGFHSECDLWEEYISRLMDSRIKEYRSKKSLKLRSSAGLMEYMDALNSVKPNGAKSFDDLMADRLEKKSGGDSNNPVTDNSFTDWFISQLRFDAFTHIPSKIMSDKFFGYSHLITPMINDGIVEMRAESHNKKSYRRLK